MKKKTKSIGIEEIKFNKNVLKCYLFLYEEGNRTKK